MTLYRGGDTELGARWGRLPCNDQTSEGDMW
jgi:hypothetical protein